MFDLSLDQAFAALLAIAIGTAATMWLRWRYSVRRAEYSAIEAAAELRARNKRIQADVRVRMQGGQL